MISCIIGFVNKSPCPGKIRIQNRFFTINANSLFRFPIYPIITSSEYFRDTTVSRPLRHKNPNLSVSYGMKKPRNKGVKIIQWNGKAIYTKHETKEINGIIHIMCPAVKSFLPIDHFCFRPRGQEVGTYILDASRESQTLIRRKAGILPNPVKNMIIDGIPHRKCNILHKFLPLSAFWIVSSVDDNIKYSLTSREGKIIENKRYANSTRKAILVWKKKNAPKVLAQNNRRRAMRVQASPPWLTKEHLFQMEKIYLESRRLQNFTNSPYHVHHIYPLHGEDDKGNHISCGLHVPWNLKPVTAKVNGSIGRKNPEYHSYE